MEVAVCSKLCISNLMEGREERLKPISRLIQVCVHIRSYSKGVIADIESNCARHFRERVCKIGNWL